MSAHLPAAIDAAILVFKIKLGLVGLFVLALMVNGTIDFVMDRDERNHL